MQEQNISVKYEDMTREELQDYTAKLDGLVQTYEAREQARTVLEQSVAALQQLGSARIETLKRARARLDIPVAAPPVEPTPKAVVADAP